MGILLALSTLMSWTLSDLFAKKTLQNLDIWFISFWGQLIGGLAVLILGIGMGKIQNLPLESLPWLLLLSALNVFGMFFFYKAIQCKGVALSLPVIYSWSIPSIFLGMIFLNQFPSALQWAGVIGAIVGIFLVSVDIRAKRWVDTGTVAAFLSMLTWGIFYFLIREPSEIYGEWLLSGGLKIGSAVLCLPFLTGNKWKNLSLSLGLIGIFDALGLITITAALQITTTAIVTGIISTTPVVVAFCGIFLFKEKVNRQQKFGILVSTIGLVLLVTQG